MARFIVLTFAFLGWGFYELSGGAEFQRASERFAEITTTPLDSVDAAVTETASAALTRSVTRIALNLTSVEDVLTGTGGANPRLPILSGVVDVTRVAAPSPDGPENDSAILPSLVDTARVNLAPRETAESAASTQQADIRSVTGSRVNVRGGPGTGFEVVNGLVRGDEVEVLEDNGAGWVRMRPIDGTETGWIAAFLLTDP